MPSLPVDIDAVMNDASLRGLFNAYLKTKFAEENSSFLYAVKQYKEITGQDILNSRGIIIRNLYIAVGSEKEINIDSGERAAIMAVPANGFRRTTFDDAEEAIKQMITLSEWAGFIAHLKANHGYKSATKVNRFRRMFRIKAKQKSMKVVEMDQSQRI